MRPAICAYRVIKDNVSSAIRTRGNNDEEKPKIQFIFNNGRKIIDDVFDCTDLNISLWRWDLDIGDKYVGDGDWKLSMRSSADDIRTNCGCQNIVIDCIDA